MLGIVITGHGYFASGLLQAVEQIVGRQPQCCAVDFSEGISTQQLLVWLEAACTACDSGKGVVILSDLLGGSPFRQAAQLAIAKPCYEVIAGTNMQLAVEMILDREDRTLETFRDRALECGRRGLTSLWHEQQKKRYDSPNLDGI
ncbi:PTS system transporter subunit IIA [Xenorhabdus beddingii]|uniref:PTS system transporter subunit IIA n=1 Tax=Xenorhabdus beddingii TaxID=40578 RepID=A0A1Y2SS12_9GAMM|nr:PTS galactosamine/N-acetylgalactosamine transporter subunit IIA [Xenorhabdus beddingii]OTA21845.1 PTS system transporter subunit IIA [Xenorhabdus beddingii]